MNIFLPYPNNVNRSVRSLDDVRLSKQILECQTIIDVDNGAKGYSNHPIVKHYVSSKRQIKFVRYFGYQCCKEFKYRFGKDHAYADRFPRIYYFLGTPQFLPLYLEGRKPNQYVTTDPKEVEFMFQAKLISKWLNDKRTPKWTKRPIPAFLREAEFPEITTEQMVNIMRIISAKELEQV